MAEIWRDIPDFEGEYQVSNMGRVKSLPGGKRHAKVLKPGGSPGCWYLHVALTGQAQRYVHHLVALAFIGPRPDGLDVCHNNGDLTDNHAENLRYGTRSENMLDAVAHGTHSRASRTHCKNDHEYTPETTRLEISRTKDGRTSNRRVCRTCENAYDRAERARKKALVAA